jgi:hypothetical protein
MNLQPKLEELIAKQDSLLEDMNAAKESGDVSKNKFYGFTEKSEEIRGAFEMDVLQEMRGKNATVGNLKIKFEQKEREINDLLTELEELRGPLNLEGGRRRKRRNSRKGRKSRKSRSSRTRRNN